MAEPIAPEGDPRPDAVLVGYQKSGTHFLRSYFEHHPAISWMREAYRFVLDDFEETRTDYLALAAEKRTTRCLIDVYEPIALGYTMADASTLHTSRLDVVPDTAMDTSPVVPDRERIAERIKAILPEAKILLILRNQVDWIRSNYLYFLEQLPPGRRSLYDFFTTPEGKLMLEAGAYHRTIELYRRLFGREKVHVMLLEEVQASLPAVLAKLCAFLGVEAVEHPPEKRDRHKGRALLDGKLLQAESAWRLPVGTLRRTDGSGASWLGKCLRPLLRGGDVFSRKDLAWLTSLYAVSNVYTGRSLGIDLAAYGYPV